MYTYVPDRMPFTVKTLTFITRGCSGTKYGTTHVRLCVDSSMRVCAGPSEAEEEEALYHLACCYSKLGELDSGLAVLRGLLELPCFHNFEVLR